MLNLRKLIKLNNFYFNFYWGFYFYSAGYFAYEKFNKNENFLRKYVLNIDCYA